MKNLRLVILLVGSVFVFNSLALAQTSNLKKVGFLDLSKIFDSYEKTKEYDAMLEGKHQEYVKQHNQKMEEINEKTGKLALLKDDEKKKIQDEIDQKKRELAEFDQAARTDLTKQRDEKIREILLEIEKIVSDFAKKEGYDMILNDRVLIFGNEQMDVSDQILKVLNEDYNKKEEKK